VKKIQQIEWQIVRETSVRSKMVACFTSETIFTEISHLATHLIVPLATGISSAPAGRHSFPRIG
jgi:hypothetical protein